MMDSTPHPTPLDPDAIARLLTAAHDDPFSVLGQHLVGRTRWVSAIDPGAHELAAVIGTKTYPLARVQGGLFSGKVPGKAVYRLRGTGADGATWDYDDAYRFGPVLTDLDEYLLGEGTHQQLWKALGAHAMIHEGTAGTHFAVWAPNARRVSVVGDFNAWDGRRHMMRRRGGTGVGRQLGMHRHALARRIQQGIAPRRRHGRAASACRHSRPQCCFRRPAGHAGFAGQAG